MENNILLSFRVKSFQPDSRQYKTTMPVIEPENDIPIVVELPLKHKFVYNAEAIIQAQLAGDKVEDARLTIAGWNYIEEQFLTRCQVEPADADAEGITWQDIPDDDDIEWKEE